jgi:hypothetical protein
MQKIRWLIVIFLFIFAIIDKSSSNYLYFSKNEEQVENQAQGEKEFLEFQEQKKKLSRINKVNTILQRLKFPVENQRVYFWHNGNNNFEKRTEDTIYEITFEDIRIISKREEKDLDNDSIFENYNLENGKLIITENKKTIWQSPSNWWIDDFVIADSNNDGVLDINLSLWKAGNFGSSKPFWIDENEMSVKNHFFVLDFVDNKVKQIWCSSNLSNPNCEFKIADINNDGKNELIVIEGDYSQRPKYKCNGNYVAIWKWNNWGFFNEWRSTKGNYINLKIDKNDKGNYIVVDAF